MKHLVHKTELARNDLVELTAYFTNESLELAIRFLDAAQRTFEMLAEHPGFGTVHSTKMVELAGLRVWPVRDFKSHLVFNQQIPDGIEVVRVLNGARDWRQT